MKKSKRLTCSPSHMKVTGRRIRDILMIGIPASITNIMQTFMMVMTNNFLLTYGTDKVAAMGIALKVNMITALVLVGFAFGGQPLVGYNYGAKNEKRLKNILKFAYLFEMGLGLLFTILMCIFAPQIIKVFMDRYHNKWSHDVKIPADRNDLYVREPDLNLRMSGRWKCRRSFCFIH